MKPMRPLAALVVLSALVLPALAAQARSAPAPQPAGAPRPAAATAPLQGQALLDAAYGRPVPAGVAKSPVATSDAMYSLCGRVFPDPLAFGPAPTSAAGESPYAKGNAACRANDYIQYDEAINGLKYLESRYPEFVEVYTLKEDFAKILDVAGGEGQSAGIATTTMERDKSDLFMVRITDERIPDAQKKKFLFTLSLHGIEKAGLEGGLRAAEDLATWGAESPGQPVMETLGTSLPTGQVLQKGAVWFALNNPDGWRRGDTSNAGLGYQRYNGNGVDLNRDFPEKGFTYRPYTPASEPETATFMKVLKAISPKWAGGVDLHGQLVDRAFSFTLLGASQRPYGKNQRMLQFTRGAYQDAETRLSWNPLIKPNDAPPACVPPGTSVEVNEPPDCDPTPRVYGVQFGSIWDTIAYTVTGAIGNWADSDLGLGADFIDNEMSLSHLSNCGTGKCYLQTAEQLHVDGNKGLIYAMLNYTLTPEDQRFRPTGRTAYLTQPARVSDPGRPARTTPSTLPLQAPITATVLKPTTGDATFEFDVQPGKANSGLKAKATYSNVQGIGPGATLQLAVDKRDDREPQPDGSEWTPVNSDFNQSPIYLQSGMQVDANDLTPGRYRVRLSGPTPAAANLEISFTAGRAWPDPGQLPYDVSNLDFFRDLEPFTADGVLTPVAASDVASGKASLAGYDSVIAVDRTFGSDPRLAAALKGFAQRGGNVVLTDDAVFGLEKMRLLPADSVSTVKVYAGSVRFVPGAEDPQNAYADPLAADVHEPGAAEGPGNRKQTTEPVPTGFSIQDAEGNDAGSLPQTGVDPAAWEEAGGRVVGTVGDSDGDEVTYGELTVGKGKVRILGSLLPMPTEEFDHTFGLSAYSITPPAYAMLRNLISYDIGAQSGPGVVAPPVAGGPTGGAPGGSSGGGLAATGAAVPLAALGALLLLSGVLAARRRA